MVLARVLRIVMVSLFLDYVQVVIIFNVVFQKIHVKVMME